MSSPVCLYNAVCGWSWEWVELASVGGMAKEVGHRSQKAEGSEFGTRVSKEECMLPGGCANHIGIFFYIYFYLHKRS